MPALERLLVALYGGHDSWVVLKLNIFVFIASMFYTKYRSRKDWNIVRCVHVKAIRNGG